MGIDFTILISGGGFTDQLMQFRAFYKLGRSLGLRYRHTPFESERSGRGIFEFLGFNQQFDAVLAPASDRPPLEIPLSDERLEREAASSFAGVQTLVRREIEARAGADSLIAFRLTGGRAFFADIHAALSEEPDELDLRAAYARHRARQPWRSRFEPNTIQILVHIRQGDTAVIRTPWDTFVPLRGPDALREVDEIDEPLRSSLIDVPEYADLLAALMRGLDEPCSAVVCSDGYALPFRKIRQHAEQLGLTDGQRRQLSELETTYQSRFDVFRGMPRTTCLIGEGEEHLFDLVHAALSADIMVVGTQQRMIPKLIASYPDLERPQILALLHRTAEPPDHERDLGLGPRQATLVPVQVGERNLEHAVDRIRHVLAERPRLGPVRPVRPAQRGTPPMTMAGKQFDIAMVGDFRFPGGTSSCMAQEIKAQARAGYRTALVQVPAPVLKKRRAFNPSIMACLHAGQATVVPVEEPLSARLVLIHHPLVFAQRPERSPRIDASVKRLIVHQPPADGTQAEPRYDVRAVQEVVRGLFGEGIQWAPVGPLVRENLPGPETGIEVTDSDWFNLIDVDEWAVDRSRFVGDRPVIGRHGRPEWHKWPASAEVILAAYPRDERFRVKILGGAEAAERIIGERPSNWRVYPFGAMHPRKFLREIDFFVYYHHPEWIEAFGRTILEALASGCPVIVPRHFEALFEDACLYADPSEVRAIVEALYADPSRSREIGSRGQTFVRERFGLEVHQRRVRALIGDPSSPAATTVASVRPQRRRVLFLTSNGEGMGHLTRMMAIARRARGDIEPIFATLSLALKVVREAGSFAEFIPRHPEWHWSIWNPFLERRLLKIIDRYGAEAVVFDGNAPYQGVISARQAAACPFVWVRRAMWKKGEGKTFLERSRHFDLVIEPGEFAAEFDRGLTVAHRSDILCVPPIVMLDRSEALGREEARAALGLNPGAQTVLLQLGSDNTNDIASPAWIAAERLLREPDTAVVVAEWLISRRPLSLPKGVRRVRIYPLSRYLNAFDFAISAAGYNSFHELVAFGIPSIFVPMDKPSEDQSGRTRYAEQVGAGLHLQPFTEQGLDRCLETMRRPEARRDMVAACTALFPGNGAGEAMEAIERLIGAGSAPPSAPSIQVRAEALEASSP